MFIKNFINLGLIFACLISNQTFAKQYYKWVDSKGNTTYSSKPPPTGTKQQKIETIRSLGTTNTSTPKQTYQSNASIPDKYVNYQNKNRTTYTPPRQPERSAEDETLRKKIIEEASTPHKGARGLTKSQRDTLAAMAGVNVSSGDSYSNSGSSYSAPMPPPTQVPTPTHMTSCDGSGCWDNQGNRYNGNNGTYFNNGRTCRDIGGQMQCN